MNHEIPEEPTQEPTPEELRKKLEEQEEEAQLAAWLEAHPEPEVGQKNTAELGPEIREFLDLVSSFELRHSLEDLTAITDLTPQEAPAHPIREPARLALIPIVEKLKALRNEGNISDAELDEINKAYKVISQAVGIISNNKVDHTR